MAKKKTTDQPAAAPVASDPAMMGGAPVMPGMPGAMPGMVPGMPGAMPGMMPGMMPGAGMGGGNPMLAMFQMMQMMAGGGGMPGMGVDPSALPFQPATAVADGDPGLDAAIIRPALLPHRLKTQEPVTLGSVLDYLCLTPDGTHALGGVPKGCTIAFAGPPGQGKTRSCLAGLVKVAERGEKVGLVVAEEGFHTDEPSGRDDLCSRLCKIGMEVTGLDEKGLEDKVLKNICVLESQYHKGQTWDDFVTRYRYLVEKEAITFVVIDSLNMLDPTKNRTADNLSALKTYNHERGVTCICIGQIRDTGSPVGGEPLMHTADVVFLIEEMSLGSKEMADLWGGKYRDKIHVIHAVKSVTTPTFPHPIHLGREPATGVLTIHAAQPAEYAVPDVR